MRSSFTLSVSVLDDYRFSFHIAEIAQALLQFVDYEFVELSEVPFIRHTDPRNSCYGCACAETQSAKSEAHNAKPMNFAFLTVACPPVAYCLFYSFEE